MSMRAPKYSSLEVDNSTDTTGEQLNLKKNLVEVKLKRLTTIIISGECSLFSVRLFQERNDYSATYEERVI